jgi:hypothetical protein
VVSVTLLPLFTPGEKTHGTHSAGGWVSLRAGLVTETRGKISCLCRRSIIVFWDVTNCYHIHIFIDLLGFERDEQRKACVIWCLTVITVLSYVLQLRTFGGCAEARVSAMPEHCGHWYGSAAVIQEATLFTCESFLCKIPFLLCMDEFILEHPVLFGESEINCRCECARKCQRKFRRKFLGVRVFHKEIIALRIYRSSVDILIPWYCNAKLWMIFKSSYKEKMCYKCPIISSQN